MTIRYEDAKTMHSDVMQFVKSFPELRDGLALLQDHFRGLVGITIHLEERNFSFEKPADVKIPTWDDIEEDSKCKHEDFFCACPDASEDYTWVAEIKEQ